MSPEPVFQDDHFKRLWLDLCAGDREAFAGIAEHCYQGLFHYGTRFTKDDDMIKDCIQDLFLDVWEKCVQLNGVLNPRAYLFQAFRNNLLHRIRHQARFSGVGQAEELASDVFSPEAAWIEKESEAQLLGKLQQGMELLPRRQREALYLRYYENLNYEEVAEIMGLRRQAVANYLQYGMQKLREFWQQTVITILCWILLQLFL